MTETDYLGRPYVNDPEETRRLIEAFEAAIGEADCFVVVAALETLIAKAVTPLATTRLEAHGGVDAICRDIKECIDAYFAERDQRRDVTGHA